MKFLIKAALILIVGILVYNYFWGTPEEKATSTQVYTKVKDLTVSVVDVLKQEKDKFNKGKYDTAIDKVENVISTLRSNKKELSSSEQNQVEQLNLEKDQLKTDIERTNKLPEKEADEASKKLDDRLMNLLHKAEEIVRKK